MNDFIEPELGEYRAIRETNTITGKHRWIVGRWARTQTSPVGEPTYYSDCYWTIIRDKVFSTRREAEEFAADVAAEHAWVRDA